MIDGARRAGPGERKEEAGRRGDSGPWERRKGGNGPLREKEKEKGGGPEKRVGLKERREKKRIFLFLKTDSNIFKLNSNSRIQI